MQNVTRVPARLPCVPAACRARNVTRILPSCDDGLPRNQVQEHQVDALDTQDYEVQTIAKPGACCQETLNLVQEGSEGHEEAVVLNELREEDLS